MQFNIILWTKLSTCVFVCQLWSSFQLFSAIDERPAIFESLWLNWFCLDLLLSSKRAVCLEFYSQKQERRNVTKLEGASATSISPHAKTNPLYDIHISTEMCALLVLLNIFRIKTVFQIEGKYFHIFTENWGATGHAPRGLPFPTPMVKSSSFWVQSRLSGLTWLFAHLSYVLLGMLKVTMLIRMISRSAFGLAHKSHG